MSTSHTLLNRLQGFGFFGSISQSTQPALAAELSEITLPEGAVLFEQDEAPDGMYFLDTGRLEVLLRSEAGPDVCIDHLVPGKPVGEMSLLSGHTRSTTIRALEDSQLIRLTLRGYRALVEQEPDLQQSILEIAKPRFQRIQMVGVLRANFGHLDMRTIHELQAQVEWRHISGGEMLFRQGEPGDCLAILVNGRLRIREKNPDGSIRFSTEIGRGQTVGEFSLLTGEPRSADVYATRATDLILLSDEAFARVTQSHPQIGLQMAKNIAVRNVAGGERAEARLHAALSLALVPVSADLDLITFAGELAEAMEAFGPTLLLTAATFDTHFGKDGAAQTTASDPIHVSILSWLAQMEEKFRFILYVAAPGESAWTRRCLQQADRLVLVADPKADPVPGPWEKSLLEAYPFTQRELLLLYPGVSAQPRHTAEWLVARDVGPHYHHLRLGSNRDLRRFIRRLTGRPVGLVLSGGAARGFAHIGVFRALVEAGVEVDLIGGTSSGAMFGAGIAAEFDDQTMMELFRHYSSKRVLLDFTYPIASLLQTKKMSRMLYDTLGDREIEDLFHPYFCVSSNLTEMRPMVHQSGPLWEAVRASIAIPGIFAPVNHHGQILVDGGVMNNLPIDLMREFCEAGPIIAVDVSPKKENVQQWDFETSISGWEVLLSRLNPLAPARRVPSLFETILYSMTVNSTYRLQQARIQADLLIQPDTRDYGIMDFEAFEELIALGYETAVPAVARWLASKA